MKEYFSIKFLLVRNMLSVIHLYTIKHYKCERLDHYYLQAAGDIHGCY